MDEPFLESLRRSDLLSSGALADVDRAALDLDGEVIPRTLIARLGSDDALAPEHLWALRFVDRVHALGFRIDGLLGRGGGGYVFKVTREADGVCLAMKVLREDYSGHVDPSDRAARFGREVELLRQGKYSSVPRIVQDEIDGRYPLFFMDYIGGRNLGRLAGEMGQVPLVIGLDLAVQASLILAEMAKDGVVHRDIKPDNLILDHRGKLWLVDFGLARSGPPSHSASETRSNLVAGTSPFMAPEQLSNPRAVNAQTDVCSLGLTLFTLLSGQYYQAADEPVKAHWLRHEDLSYEEKDIKGRSFTKFLLEEMLGPQHGRPMPDALFIVLRSLLSELRHRRPSLVDACVENLRAIDPAPADDSRTYDEVDRQRLLLLCETPRARWDELGTVERFVESLHRAGSRIDEVQANALTLLARRKGGVRQVWFEEPGLVIRFQSPASEDFRILKLLPLPPEDKARLKIREYFRVIGELNHPNITRLLATDENKSCFYAEMGFVGGRDLLMYRREGGTPTWSEVVVLINAILKALEAIHGRGVAHGGIKPANVLVPSSRAEEAGGRVVLIGLGTRVDATLLDDLQDLGNLLLYLLCGREIALDSLTPELVREHLASEALALPSELVQFLDLLLFQEDATIREARGAWSSLSPPLHIPVGGIVPDYVRFHRLLTEMGGQPALVPERAPDEPGDRVPRFLLFRRSGQVVMAVVSEGGIVRPYGLRRSSSTETPAELLSEPEVRDLGFRVGEVHPAFLDPGNHLQHIIVDALLLAHAIFEPQAPILLPWSDAGTPTKLRTTIGAWLKALFRMHGTRKVFFANATRGAWQEDRHIRDLLESRPIHTRFAPTPSGGLHLGNVRTALASYLVALRSALKLGSERAMQSFHLRIDDTDLDRLRKGSEEQIKRELRWLGLRWEKKQEFAQNARESRATYATVERALRSEGLLGLDPITHESYLDLDAYSEHEYGGYYNLVFDLRRGPLVYHRPPRDRDKDNRVIKLTRGDGTPFYRFAGCIDDLGRTTIVFRDREQFDLSLIQSHIRHGIERLRQKLNDPRAPTTSRSRLAKELREALRMPEGSMSVPLVIYGHLQLLVDGHGKLSKRRVPEARLGGASEAPGDLQDDGPLTIRGLRRDGVAPEAILAYLLTTLLPQEREDSPFGPLRSLVKLFAEVGAASALLMLAPDVYLKHLVGSSKDIHCYRRWVDRANRMFIDALPVWRADRLFEDPDPDAGTWPLRDASKETQARIYERRSEFADLRQVCDVVRGPSVPPVAISGSTCGLLLVASSRCRWEEVQDPARLVRCLLDVIREKRAQAQHEPGERPSLRDSLRDLRLLLTGAETSPAIETILQVLDPQVAVHRFNTVDWSGG